jgi:alkenylglycerophosphocholine hydrolase
MSFTLIWIALLIAVLDWFAVATQRKTLEFFAKPGVMIFLLAWMWQTSGFHGALVWFGLGLAFSMAGDIFLMLPRERFIPGLIAFLLAHVAYIVGFNQTPPSWNLPAFIITMLVAFTILRVYRRIAAGLVASGNSSLRPPVLVYSLVISLMLVSALLTLTGITWQALPAMLVSAGALLFFISDTLLAWNKFVQRLKYGPLAVIITYHLGQTLLAVGAVLHYLPGT